MSDVPTQFQDAKDLLTEDGFAVNDVWYHGTSSALWSSIKENGINRSGDRDLNKKAKNTMATIGNSYTETIQPVFLTQSKELAYLWAEKAVKEAATLTATEALEMDVINLIANTPQQLLEQLDGYTLQIKDQSLTLTLKHGQVKPVKPDWRSQFIATITDPNIAYILLMIGIYGLILEFYSPGIGVAGIIGGIALLVALYALQLLPLNFVGLGLLILGISLLIIESLIPSFGIFGIGGVIAFVIGSIFLIDTEQHYFKISMELIAALAISSAGFFVFVLGYLWRLRKKRVVSDQESLIGGQAIALDTCYPSGFVSFGGERWAAQSPQPLTPGQNVIIQAINGLELQVTTNPLGEATNGTHSQH